MCAQFGTWNIDRKPVRRDELLEAEKMLAPLGPDGVTAYVKDCVGILNTALHITRESRKETQPHVTRCGVVLTWDGRLDNRSELLRDLGHPSMMEATDPVVVGHAFDTWGTACFARLIGDWALSLWDPGRQLVLLAKDPIGTRHLYYTRDERRTLWSTLLDPLPLLSGRRFAVSEEYVAGWLSFNPAAHLTPYAGIHSVPPCSFVELQARTSKVRKYWGFAPVKTIFYKTDREYEEHFLLVFKEAVRRRLRSDRPVLAELSGGMDSSSIVCVADTLIGSGEPVLPRLDTISYHNDSETDWDEKPYFAKVEQRRGRAGWHIDTSSIEMFDFDSEKIEFQATPAHTASGSNKAAKQFASLLRSHGHRVLLSGIGGDEVMGGVPTPTPQLQDLVTMGRFGELAHELRIWALATRRPWPHLLFDALGEFSPLAVAEIPKSRRPAAWLRPDFVQRYRLACAGYRERVRFFGARPSFQANLSALESVRRQLACEAPAIEPPFVKCYPYLDRSLLEFVYSIPREQLIRAGQRRSLMRRALAGIVPSEILDRKRKAFASRRSRAAISAEWASLSALSRDMSSALWGFIEKDRFVESLRAATNDQSVPLVLLMRTLFFEVWLRNQIKVGALCETPPGSSAAIPWQNIAISAETNQQEGR